MTYMTEGKTLILGWKTSVSW